MELINRNNPNHPYIFVSYSSADSIQVYSDIIRLQEYGVNIWIDTELDFHVGERWQSRVHAAMKSANCKAVLFFVSEASLTSSNVYDELAFSVSDAVKNTHYGNGLAFLPIEVTPISDITSYCFQLASEYSILEQNASEDSRSLSDNISLIRSSFFPNNDIKRFRIFDRKDITPLIELMRDMQVLSGEKTQTKLPGGQAFYDEAMELQEKNNYKDSIESLVLSAIQGYYKAYLSLGQIYAMGKYGEQRNVRRAEGCFLRAFDLGSPAGLYNIAQIKKGQKNYAKAAELLIKAASLPDATVKLRTNCKNGLISIGELQREEGHITEANTAIAAAETIII